MAFDTYSNLKAAVVRFSGRDDLSPVIDDFIALAESQMFNNEYKTLLADKLESSASLVTVAGTNSVSLPTDYLGQRSLTLVTGNTEYELQFNTPSAISKSIESGMPVYFTIEGSNLVFDRIPDDAYDLSLAYYAKNIPLSSTNQTNVVLTNFPDIYLMGVLSNLYKYTSELDDSVRYFQDFISAIKGAVKGSNRRTHPNPQGKVRGVKP